ncbi:MAG: serine/threonine-protein kinase [Planctomycetota bacterium]
MSDEVLRPEALVGQRLGDDRYKVISQLGTGSMGHVYRAFDYRLESEVVIKVPTESRLRDAGFRRRFLRESRLLVQLDHPHIVRIMDVGEHQEIPYVVMQLLGGGTLRDKCEGPEGRMFPLSPESLNDWLREVAKALDYMHTKGIIHRDVKPANILFDDTGNAYLSDFGLSKILHGEIETADPSSTVAGGVVGTPDYVAPELVLGMSYDGRADQYSLGISIYELLIGRPPMRHPSNSGSGTMVNQTQKRLKLLSDVRDDVSPALAAAVNKAIAKKPEARFATCVEFAEAALAGVHGSKQPAPSAASAAAQSTLHSGASDSVPAQSVARRRPKRPGAAKTARGEYGKVPCPQCGRVLPLEPHFAGRRGRCAKCETPLLIGEDLRTLTVVTGKAASASRSNVSSRDQNSPDSSDLVLGDKLFGLELSKKVAVAVAAITVLIMLGTTIFLTLTATKDEEPEQLKHFRSLEGGR